MDEFATPGAFGLVLVVAAVAVGYLWAQRRRRSPLPKMALEQY